MSDYLKQALDLARKAERAFVAARLHTRTEEFIPALCDAIEAQAAKIAKLQDTALYDAFKAQAAEIERLRAYIKLLENSHT